MPLRAATWWIDRWRKSTAYTDMTLEQQGAYRNLLDELWLRDGVLPDDDRILGKIAGDAKRWSKLRDVVLARFVKTDRGWINRTHNEVAAAALAYQQQQSDKGKHGAEVRWHGKGKKDGRGNAQANGREHGREHAPPIAEGMAAPMASGLRSPGRAEPEGGGGDGTNPRGADPERPAEPAESLAAAMHALASGGRRACDQAAEEWLRDVGGDLNWCLRRLQADPLESGGNVFLYRRQASMAWRTERGVKPGEDPGARRAEYAKIARGWADEARARERGGQRATAYWERADACAREAGIDPAELRAETATTSADFVRVETCSRPSWNPRATMRRPRRRKVLRET